MKINSQKHRATAAMIAASFFMSAAPFTQVMAGGKKGSDKTVAAASQTGLTTNYIGQKDNNIIIRLATSQVNEHKSYLRIYDATGELLFEDIIYTRTAFKLISVSPAELQTIQVVYSSGDLESRKTLAINSVNEMKYSVSEIAKLK